MEYITIDTKRVPIEGEKNILSLIRKAGIDLPTFCYHSELSIYGACRMCVVEDDRGRIFASCSEQPRDGMVIHTNSKKIQSYRRLIIELLLSSHCRDCTTCQKNGSCSLQDLAYRVGVHAVRFLNNKKQIPLDMSSPSIVRDPNKCILCGDCVRTCDEIQGIGAIDFAFRGSETQVMPAFNRDLADTDCVGCGQCAVVCPTAAITVRTNVTEIWDAIGNPNIRVVVQVAPAVRVAVGDSFNIPKGENSFGKLVTALRIMGFDEVYDTSFGADLTVMEESKELAQRLEKNEKLPLFTSCCPGWVKYCENRYPDLTDNISTCRSPQGMLSPLIKDYFKDKDEAENKKTIVVSIMPCTAKKGEILRPDNFTDGMQDTDYVITTQEVIRMIKQVGIQFESLEAEAADMPFAVASGGGTIFGTTGGVTEAVLRRLAKDKSYQNLSNISYVGVRGEDSVKEASVMLGDREVKIAVVHGLADAGRLLDKVKAGEVEYDFVEVMACRRGCIMGGGQPPFAGARTKKKRMEGLYKADTMSNIRYPDENPVLLQMYETTIKGKEHKLFHRHMVEK
ncbi:[FeFe] hydrogenase, group A [Candidatus Galacturonibacter soehngenii]|uniref:2Fe-2S iron-sulfur cluster binding domain-containing protein n=1 Tax=Candidatus Galacturonatibacter soehngenii TaxID=2307010 RepID=A0A7V7UBC4_9FIRM|nr:[FeFe] hydrogenase, group A [Candidatus Galacturonibacter soehngenii]KAB1437825.1 2Fe-2S iron-sulfur cluster binding domain-containing protein [Candidatus Galacturonibacter soehngenii]MBA4687406.1 (2Fe-2S)-binding protein [Candidatus Galacturonibacter soehngenii]